MGNQVHSTVIIGKNVNLGDNNIIGPYCILHDGVNIGDNNAFVSHVSIGSAPEHKTVSDNKGTSIGSNNTFREFITINSGCFGQTSIGNNGFFMRNVHFGHDASIGDFVTLSCSVLIGGCTKVMDFANLGLNAITHQNIVIPPLCMIGMGAVVTKAEILKPGKIYVGNPARYLKENTVGIERSNLSKEEINKLSQVWLFTLAAAQRQAHK